MFVNARRHRRSLLLLLVQWGVHCLCVCCNECAYAYALAIAPHESIQCQRQKQNSYTAMHSSYRISGAAVRVAARITVVAATKAV